MLLVGKGEPFEAQSRVEHNVTHWEGVLSVDAHPAQIVVATLTNATAGEQASCECMHVLHFLCCCPAESRYEAAAVTVVNQHALVNLLTEDQGSQTLAGMQTATKMYLYMFVFCISMPGTSLVDLER